MRILIANDKFKGSLAAGKAGVYIKNSLENAFPEAVFDLCPIADGGEGTAQAMTAALASALSAAHDRAAWPDRPLIRK